MNRKVSWTLDLTLNRIVSGTHALIPALSPRRGRSSAAVRVFHAGIFLWANALAAKGIEDEDENVDEDEGEAPLSGARGVTRPTGAAVGMGCAGVG